MEKDSFEKVDVADVLNKHFVAIKVDREERPDIDQYFMHVVQSLTGHGGWPTTILLTPDGNPLWAGTFLQREQLKKLCDQIAQMWQSAGQRLQIEGERIRTWFQENALVQKNTAHAENLFTSI